MEQPSELLVLCTRLLLAIVLAGLLGMERQRKGRGAGLRTHILVCLGSTLVMTVSDILVHRSGGAPGWTDTGRMAAGILTGVGFLGAGTIMTVGSGHKGLTTAAMIWFAAALGVAIGSGLYVTAILATILAFVVVLGFEYLELLLPGSDRMVVTLRVPDGLNRLDGIEKAIAEKGFHVSASRLKMDREEDHVEMTIELVAPAKNHVHELLAMLRERIPDMEKIVIER